MPQLHTERWCMVNMKQNKMNCMKSEMQIVVWNLVVSCSGDFLYRLQVIYADLALRFDAKKVVGRMFAQQAIGLRELQSIQNFRTPCEAAEHLLEIILKVQSRSIYECFLKALNETNQQHISSWISLPGNVVLIKYATWHNNKQFKSHIFHKFSSDLCFLVTSYLVNRKYGWYLFDLFDWV